MATYHKVEVTIKSARNLKNINWKNGDLRPYAVVWVDPSRKLTTTVDYENGENPVWDKKLNIEIPDYKRVEDCSLFIDIVHDDSLNELPKKIVGSGKLPLLDVLADANNAGKITQTITLIRPSGRPQGKLEVKVSIKELPRYDPYAPRYGNPTPAYPTPESGYSQPAYGYSYGSASAPSAPPPSYGYSSGTQTGYVSVGEPVKKSGIGLGTGLAVGAAAGILGGLALAEGMEHVEDKIAEKAARKVKEDGGACYGGSDSYYQPEGSYYQPDDWSF